MKRSIFLPKIQVDYFNNILFNGDSSVIYHLYVNDEFYRAFNSHDELEAAITAIVNVELTGV